jgi:hypothetical protein
MTPHSRHPIIAALGGGTVGSEAAGEDGHGRI